MRRLLICTALASTLLPLAAAAQISIGSPKQDGVQSEDLPRLFDDLEPRPSLADRPVGRPGPDQEAPIRLEKLATDNSVLRDARVTLLGAPEGSDNSWSLSIIERPLLLSRLLELRQVHKLPPVTVDTETGYRGIEITLYDHDGTRYAPIQIFRDQVRMYGTHPLLRDSGRSLEYWVASTAKTVGQFNVVSLLMPPASYDECQVMGFQIFYSTPRQCVLADGTTFIEGARPIPANARPIVTFEDCEIDPQNRVINTFPRKCIAPGGRLLIEPPPKLNLPQQAEETAEPEAPLPAAPQPVELPPLESTEENEQGEVFDETLPPEDVPLPPTEEDAFIPPQPEPTLMNDSDMIQ